MIARVLLNTLNLHQQHVQVVALELQGVRTGDVELVALHKYLQLVVDQPIRIIVADQLRVSAEQHVVRKLCHVGTAEVRYSGHTCVSASVLTVTNILHEAGVFYALLEGHQRIAQVVYVDQTARGRCNNCCCHLIGRTLESENGEDEKNAQEEHGQVVAAFLRQTGVAEFVRTGVASCEGLEFVG